MRVPLAALLALAAGVFGRAHPVWGCALLASAVVALWPVPTALLGRCLAAAALIVLSVAGWRGAVSPVEPPLSHGEERRFRGTVAEDPSLHPGGVRMLVDLSAEGPAEPGSWTPRLGRIDLRVQGQPTPPAGRGDVVAFRGRLRPPWGLRNPGGSGFEHYLARRDVAARVSVEWPGEAVFAQPGPGALPWLRWRRSEVDRMRAVAPGQQGAVLAALSLGDWSAVAPETADAFRRAGTTHLLAISGLHLGIVALLVQPGLHRLLSRLPAVTLRTPVEPIARLLTLPILGAYAGVAGLQTSTARSLAMASLVVAGSALSRPVHPLGLLASAVLILGVLKPSALTDPGLQLSAAALAGLFWLAPRIEARLSGEAEAPDPLAPPRGRMETWAGASAAWARRLAAAGLAASLATAPISAFHFGSASLLGLALNPLAVPFVEFLCLPAALVGTALHGLWPWGGESLWRLSATGLGLLLRAQAALVPGAVPLRFAALCSPLGCMGALAVLVALGLALQRPVPRRSATAVALAGTVALLVPGLASWARERLDSAVHLWALDVGQGQAVAIRVPPDRWLLVDAGGFPGSSLDVGDKVVMPAIEALGAERLWLAVSTHPHPDHTLGLPSAVRRGRPERLWLPSSFRGDPRYAPALEAALSVGAAVEWVGPAGVVREEAIGPARLAAVWFDGAGENDRSLVLRLRLGSAAALLPADLEAGGQRLLLAAGFPARCEVLVAPHHGAASALHSPFLQEAHPKAVFVSASGRTSLPSPAFLDAVGRLPAEVFATFGSGCLHATLGPDGVAAGPADGVRPVP